MTVVPAEWDDDAVQRLAAAQQAEVRARYDGKGEPGTPPSAADISVVLLARDDDGTALGCGALRRLGDGVAEIKRMYVAPPARGRGIAKALLAALEDAARDRGWTTLRLETGPRQPEAQQVFEAAGYVVCEPWGQFIGKEFSVCMEKLLVPSRT